MSRVLAIEIGMDKTKLCEAAATGKTPKIYRTLTFDTPHNAVEDGYIRDKAVLESVLRQQLKKAGIKTKDVVYTVASTKIANREVTIPPVKKEKIQQVIEANAQEYFPVDVGDYTISYSVLEKITEGEEKGWRLMALAVPDNLIKNYYSFSESLGFRVKNMDYMGNSAFQIFKRQETGGVNLSLMLNEETTMIYVIDHGVLALQRTIPYGTRTMIEEVMSRPVFAADSERAAAEKLQTEEILFQNLGQEWEDSELFAARRGVTDSIDYLIGNLIRVIDFFHTRKEDKQIEKILLAGQGAKIKGLCELIGNETGIETKRIDKPVGVSFGKQSLPEGSMQDDYISCVGALIEPLQLKSKEQLAKKNRKSVLSGAKVILGLSAAVSLLLVGVSAYQVSLEKSEEKRLDEAIAKLSAIQEIYAENGRVQKEYEQYKTALQKTETETEKLDELFRELEQQLPKTVIVDYLSLDGQQLSMSIRAKNKLSTARLLMNLKQIKLLTDISLPSMTKTADESGESWSYSITARFAGAVEKETDAMESESKGQEAENEEN